MKRIFILMLVAFGLVVTGVAQGVQSEHRTTNLARGFNFEVPAMTDEARLASEAYLKAVQGVMAKRNQQYKTTISAQKRLEEADSIAKANPKKALSKKQLDVLRQQADVEISARDTASLSQDEAEEFVTKYLPLNREQLAVVCKDLIDREEMVAAGAIAEHLYTKEPRYPYTKLLRAYYHLHKADQEALNATDYTSYAATLLVVTDVFGQLAEAAKTDVEKRRTFNMIAGESAYLSGDDQATRNYLTRVLKDSPSPKDSLDVYVMLAQFERTGAAQALKDSDRVGALDFYNRAIDFYSRYIQANPTLPTDQYASDVVEGYLFCLSNRAGVMKNMNNDVSGYRRLLQESNRFMEYNKDDIRTHRYKLTALFQLCAAETDAEGHSFVFPKIKDDYLRSMEYVTNNQFPVEYYTYDDYNMTQQGATWNGDNELRAQYLNLALQNVDPTRISRTDQGKMLAALALTRQATGDFKGEIESRKLQIAEMLKDDPTADVGANELNLAQAYMRIVTTQAEAPVRSMEVAEIESYAQQADSLLNKYIYSTNEDYAVNSLTAKRNLLIDVMKLGDGDLSVRYFNNFRDTMLRKIEWSRTNDRKRVAGHANNLLVAGFNYLKSADKEHLLDVANSVYVILYNQYNDQEDDYDRLAFAQKYVGLYDNTVIHTMDSLKVGLDIVQAMSDTIDAHTLQLLREDDSLNATLQNEMQNAQRMIREQLVAGVASKEEDLMFMRRHYFDNFVNIHTSGKKSFLNEIAGRSTSQLAFYRDNIINAWDDLTEDEKQVGYSMLANAYYEMGYSAYQYYIDAARRNNALLRAGKRGDMDSVNKYKAQSLSLFTESYYYAYKAAQAGSTDANEKKNNLENMNFAAPAIEEAGDRIQMEKAEEMDRKAEKMAAQKTANPETSDATTTSEDTEGATAEAAEGETTADATDAAPAESTTEETSVETKQEATPKQKLTKEEQKAAAKAKQEEAKAKKAAEKARKAAEKAAKKAAAKAKKEEAKAKKAAEKARKAAEKAAAKAAKQSKSQSPKSEQTEQTEPVAKEETIQPEVVESK